MFYSVGGDQLSDLVKEHTVKATSKTGSDSILGLNNDCNSPKKSISSSDMLALEPRILFDGAGIVTGIETLTNDADSNGLDVIVESKNDKSLRLHHLMNYLMH